MDGLTKAFRDVLAYCQAELSSGCAGLMIRLRDEGECSVDATYRIIDALASDDDRVEALNDLVEDVLIPAGDCLGYDE